MCRKELDRVGVIRKVADRELVHHVAALQLGLSLLQFKRLVRAFRDQGDAGLVSGLRSRLGNNSVAASVREHFIGLVCRHYHDFGATLAHEKLAEQHGFKGSVETLRT